jgi:hypothetical protein
VLAPSAGAADKHYIVVVAELAQVLAKESPKQLDAAEMQQPSPSMLLIPAFFLIIVLLMSPDLQPESVRA